MMHTVTDRVAALRQRKLAGDPIVMLTAYDAPTARAEDDAGVDILLVGDSVGTNVLGYSSEREVTLDDIAHHVRAVGRGAQRALILADLPAGTYETPEQALANARHLIGCGAHMVKFEGPRPEIASHLSRNGIAVCGHLGLQPQHHDKFRVQGRETAAALAILDEAADLEAAGISLLVVELVPVEVGAALAACLTVPVIGIGAGPRTDGQVLVVNDMIGITERSFRHNRRYAEAGSLLHEAFARYVDDVRARSFPTSDNAVSMSADQAEAFRRAWEARRP